MWNCRIWQWKILKLWQMEKVQEEVLLEIVIVLSLLLQNVKLLVSVEPLGILRHVYLKPLHKMSVGNVVVVVTHIGGHTVDNYPI